MRPHLPPSFLEVGGGEKGMSVDRSTPERPDRPDPMGGGEKISNAKTDEKVGRARGSNPASSPSPA